MDGRNIDVLNAAVARRLEQASDQISRTLDEISRGNPLGAETSDVRLVDRLQLKTGLTQSQAEDLAGWIRSETPAAEAGEPKPGRMEALIGPSLDFVGVAFFDKGRAAADAVVRIRFRDGRPQGSGVLVGPGIILTNNHVISSPADSRQFVVEFDFERTAGGDRKQVTTFELQPEGLFVTDPLERLDFTLIALGRKMGGPRDAAAPPLHRAVRRAEQAHAGRGGQHHPASARRLQTGGAAREPAGLTARQRAALHGRHAGRIFRIPGLQQ